MPANGPRGVSRGPFAFPRFPSGGVSRFCMFTLLSEGRGEHARSRACFQEGIDTEKPPMVSGGFSKHSLATAYFPT